MKRRAAILLAGLSLAVAAAPAAPPVVVTRRNGQVIMRFGNGPISETFTDPDEGENTEAPTPAPGAAGKLRWQDGETLPGELAGASDSALTWRTPLFEEPLLLRWSALRRYDRPGETGTVTDPFAFVLRDGSHVYGNLTAITADAVAIHSTRHGDVRLKRSEVLSMRRIRRDGLPAGGPTGTVDWRLLSDQDQSGNPARPAFGTPAPTAVAALVTGPGGALDLPYWNTAVFREMEFPESVDLEFRVRATKRPDFSLVLEPGPAQNLRIATWDGEVVLAAGAQFVSLGHLADADREVAFRVCWDRRTDHCLVTTPDGVRVVDWQFEAAEGPPREGEASRSSPNAAVEDRLPSRSSNAGSNHSGLMLYNKGRDLTLEGLRVRAWDGTPPAPVDSARPGLWLADGRAVQGEIVGGSAEAVRLRLGGADAVASFPLGEVDAIVFSPGAPAAPHDPPMTLTWADGTFLTGRMVGLDDGIAAISTPCADAPLPARVDGLRQLLLPLAARDQDVVRGLSDAPPRAAGQPPGATQDRDTAVNPLPHRDKITAGDMTLHGDLSCLDDDQPHWLPVGGVRPAVPSRQLAYEIDRAHPAAAEGPAAPALFYTSAGDILPGDLRSLDASRVDFDSGYVETKKFQPGDLDAIQFIANVPARIDGFSGPGWQVVEGDAARIERKEDGSLKLAAGTALGHAWIMECSELRFVLANADSTALRLRMFCADTDGSKAVNLALVRNGSTLYYGLEATEGQMESQQSTNLSKEAVPVRLVVTDQQVELFLGDKRLETFSVPLAKRSGSGLVIEPAAMWGNPMRAVELSGFAAEFRPGHVGMPAVNAEAKRQALTVPRFRKDDPPRQALIALNGDVLRGELTGATTSHFAFRSGLESLRVPRERVRAAVWLKPPGKEAATDSKPAVAERLEKRCTLNGQYANMRMRDYVSIIFQWDPELKAKYPSHLPNQRLRMRFEQPTIAEALDQICATFDVSYRLEGDTVVFAAVGSTPPNMRQQTYWLQPDAFPDPGSVQAVLTAKGLSFPEGASVQWEPDNRQIVMTNTTENQRKLADVLRTDFGGSLGAPTHWLVLTDGTRLGLAVDHFEKDKIVGHHPIYGRCQVPLGAVAAIRASAPETSPAGRLFADWRLVVAPEPVLPGAGGAGDALAGKEPKNFTLPLLGGGDFELAREKGKVVVLDFWATWCPPCIQSLPGLIEAMSVFPADQVRFVGVNQAEPAPQVQRFLSTRGWKLAVALDASQDVGLQFGAESIPQTVVIGPDGKVARVWTGYQPGEETEIADTVRKLIVDPPKPPKKDNAVPEARLLLDAVHLASPE